VGVAAKIDKALLRSIASAAAPAKD